MKEWNWNMMGDLLPDQERQGPEAVCVPCSPSCSCLRGMVHILDDDSPQQAVLQAQAVLGEVTGGVLLSVYRKTEGSDLLELVATGHEADETERRLQLQVMEGSMLASVMAGGTEQWASVDEGSIAAVGMAALRDLGQVNGVVIAEFIRDSAGPGKPSMICLRCVASAMSVVLLRSCIRESRDSLLTLARYRSVAELSVQVTHDFNNMMQGVLGNAALARMDIPGDSPAAGSLAGVEESATRASVLARKLLNFARDSSKGGTSCDAVKVSSDAVDLAGTLYIKGVAVTRDLPGHPAVVRMTDNDLENALVLLIKSAALQLQPVSGVKLTVTCDPDSEQASVILEFRGVTQAVGAEDRMDAERLTAAAGAVARRAGASLEISSAAGMMTVLLSAAREIAHASPPASQPVLQNTDLKGLHILVVGKPSPLAMLLGAAGCVVQEVPSWEEAVRGVSGFAPRAVLASAGDSEDLQSAAEGRRYLNLPVIVVCAQGVSCPPETTAALDGVLGLPLELDSLRRLLAHVLH